MHYFIDGYNLYFRLPDKKRSLEEGRSQIIAALKSVKLSLTIVFDGGQDDRPERAYKGALAIVYTAKGQSADSYILDEISWVKNPKNYTVVTSDKKLAAEARASGACSQTIAAFLTLLEKKHAVKTAEKPFKDSTKNLERLLKLFS